MILLRAVACQHHVLCLWVSAAASSAADLSGPQFPFFFRVPGSCNRPGCKKNLSHRAWDTNRAVILGGSTASNPGVYSGSKVVTVVAVKEAQKERRAFRVAGIELIGLMQALIQCHLPEMKEFRNFKFLRCAAQTVCSQAQSRRTPPSDKGGNGQQTCSARAGYRLAADAGK